MIVEEYEYEYEYERIWEQKAEMKRELHLSVTGMTWAWLDGKTYEELKYIHELFCECNYIKKPKNR